MRNIVAIDIQEDCLADSSGRTVGLSDLESIMDFIVIQPPDTFVVVWNLYQLLDAIKPLIEEKEYAELVEKDRVWVGNAGNRYKLFSSQGKRLCIGHEYRTQTKGNFYDAEKIETDVFNLNRFFPNYHPETLSDIQDKGVELLMALDDMDMGDTDTLASGIAIYGKTKLDNSFIPHYFDMPDEAIDACEYVLPLMSREWRAIYKVGCWKQTAWDVDLHGAYPSLVRDFGDLSKCKIWHSKNYQPCDWGVFKGYLTIDADISPIISEDKQPYNCSRKLEYLTTEQWGFINHYHLGKFEPVDGWLLKYTSDDKPFYELMTDIYKKRENGGLQSDIWKSIAVGLIGQFAQAYENKKGKHYNPFYSVMATSRCSLKVARLIYDQGMTDNMISVNVDGCLLDKEPSIENTGDFGSWGYEKVNALVLSVGHSYVGTKHPDNHTFDDMLKAIEYKPDANVYNDMVLATGLNITNRVFSEYPKTGKELLSGVYTSKPIMVGG